MAEDCLVLQEEEREALLSIYDGDEAFKQVSSTIYQYKVGSTFLKCQYFDFYIISSFIKQTFYKNY